MITFARKKQQDDTGSSIRYGRRTGEQHPGACQGIRNILQALHYGLTINPVNSEVYIADAIDYVQNGVVLRYSPDGELLDEFYVGIIPGAFCWR